MYMCHWASISWLGAVSKVNQHFNISGLLSEAAWVVPYKIKSTCQTNKVYASRQGGLLVMLDKNLS